MIKLTDKEEFSGDDLSTFYDPDQFDGLKPLKEHWKEIRAEYEKVAIKEVHPWPEPNLFERVDPKTKERKEGEGWNVFGLYAFGKKHVTNCEKCPITAKVVENLPYKVTTAAFSLLTPNSHIVPHTGYVGYSDRVFRCHLGLIVPPKKKRSENRIFDPQPFDIFSPVYENCRLRAANKWWDWEDGELLVFDDTLTHEAWNYTDMTRVILLLDFERPPEYMPNKEKLDKMVTRANEDPFKTGNRGDIYLNVLTSKHGY